MGQQHTYAWAYRGLRLGIVAAALGTVPVVAMADIPTTNFSADGGPPEVVQKAPRPEHRAAERPAPAANQR